MIQNQAKARRALENAGWKLRSGTKHALYYCPCGKHVVAMGRGTSPLSHRHAKNVRAQARACANCPEELK